MAGASDDRLGRSTRYLCETPETGEGVLREFAHSRPGREGWCRSSRSRRTRSADCATDPSLTWACFHVAEQANVEGRGPQGDHTFSQLIAQLVADAGFEGMRVAGERGSDGVWYANLVLFDPADRWTDWVRADVLPHVIA